MAPVLAVADTESAAEPRCAADVARRVQEHYDSVRDFAADFEQTTRSALFGASAPGLAPPSTGKVVLAKPGKMRWTYVAPQRSLVVSDGATLWLYTPDYGEAQRLPLANGYLTGAAFEFLLGEGDLLETFEVSASDCDGETVALTLVPREVASYERLGLIASKESGEVTATSVLDLFGNETRIVFQNVRRNQEPPPETFQFEPPDGVEVIDLQPAGRTIPGD